MTDPPMTKAPDLLEMPSSLNDACRKLEWADGEIISLRAQLAAAEGERDDLRLAVSGLNKDWNRAMSQLQAMRKALEFYADPFAWKKVHDPEDVVRIPDFYSETCFGDTAMESLRSLTEGAGK